MPATDKDYILVKNIYYMLSYAFKALRQDTFQKVGAESFDDAENLFAAILSNGIGQQLKQGLYREYVSREDDLPVLRGKLNIAGTVQNKILHRQCLRCQYDELSENNLLNRVLKTTALLLITDNKVNDTYRAALKKELLFFSSVDAVEPNAIRWSALTYHRNNQTYQLLMGICRFVLEGMLQTQESGARKLAAFTDSQEMYHLYEKFLLEYYRQEHPELTASAAQIPWALDDGAQTALPIMQSDITLQQGNTVLIIDAKYYAHNMQIRYNKHSIHSGNIYQIFTYVKNKEFELEKLGKPHKVSGMILYAKTTDSIQPNSVFQMHGSQITVQTLDLYQPFEKIKESLDKIVRTHFTTRELV